MQFTLSFPKRLLALLFAFIIGFFITSVIGVFVTHIFGPDSTKGLRILAVMQDVFAFILPAVAAAVISTRRPAQLMRLAAPIPLWPLLLSICVMAASIPAMNLVISLNEQIPLPESLEHTLRSMENNAAAMVEALQGPRTIPNLLLSILIVGIFAGLSEEILFRGALQRLLSTGGVNPHAAVWIAAIVFSLMHLQIYGFVPRMLLGAFFGYTLLWTRCLWVPVLLHSFNNTLYLCAQWSSAGGNSFVDTIGAEGNVIPAIISAVATALLIAVLRRASLKARRPE